MKVLSIDPGAKNLALCLLDSETLHVHDWCVLNLNATTDATPAAFHDLLRTKIPYTPEAVVVERQPPKNMAMKRIEHWLEFYFRDVPIYKSQSAARKLVWAAKHAAAEHAAALQESQHCTNRYYRRKKMSVAIVERLLEGPIENKKKDDLADAYLQARAFVQGRET